MKTRGFTLIELLILVAIIAIVGAMITNAVQDSRPCKRSTQEMHQVCIDTNPNHSGHYCDEYALRKVDVCLER